MELKPSHEVFAQALIVNKASLASAYAQAYPKASPASCRQGGWLLSKNINIQRRLRELLDQNGLGLDNCIKKLNALTEATKVQTYGKGSCGTFPDNYIRIEALRTAFKLHVLLGDVQTIPDNESNV